MSSLITLSPKPSAPTAPQSKGGLKGLVGWITGCSGNNKLAVVIPSSGEGSENHEPFTPGTVNSYKTPTLVQHSSRGSLSMVTGSPSSNSGGFLSTLTTYLKKLPKGNDGYAKEYVSNCITEIWCDELMISF
jgi:hypothetical protein